VDYKASVNWLLKGMRVDYKCEGSPQRHVEVVRDNYAWNETEPGKSGTPATSTYNDRALMPWTLPAGAIKAANDAGAATKVSTENDKTVVTYPDRPPTCVEEPMISERSRHAIGEAANRVPRRMISATH
jgi:hypothetical protein